MREFARELQSRRSEECASFFRRHGVARETWHTQETPSGLWIIAVSQFDGKPIEEAAREYVASQAPFDRWFKDQVIALTGIDPETTPLGPPTTCIFDSSGDKG